MRRAQAGTEFPQAVKSVTVPAIVAGATATVALAADAAFIGVDAVAADFTGVPEAQLGIAACFISNAATGVISIRFTAGTGGVAGAAVNILFSAIDLAGL